MGSDHPDPQTSISDSQLYPPDNWDQWWVAAEVEIKAPVDVVWAVLKEWFWDNDAKSPRRRSEMAASHASEPAPEGVPQTGTSQNYEHLDKGNISQRYELIAPEHRRLLVDYRSSLKLPRKWLYTRSKHALYRAYVSRDPSEDSTKYMVMEVVTGYGATLSRVVKGQWERCAEDIAAAVNSRSTNRDNAVNVELKWMQPKGGPCSAACKEGKLEVIGRWCDPEHSITSKEMREKAADEGDPEDNDTDEEEGYDKDSNGKDGQIVGGRMSPSSIVETMIGSVSEGSQTIARSASSIKTYHSLPSVETAPH